MDVAAEVVTRAREHGGSNPQQRKYLLDHLSKLPAEVVVTALLSIFARPEDPELPEIFAQQSLAGFLLWHGKHPCPVPLSDAIVGLLDGWNLSIEEVPWYLSREFGAVRVLACIDSLLAQHQSAHHQRVLQTLRYWVRYEPKGSAL